MIPLEILAHIDNSALGELAAVAAQAFDLSILLRDSEGACISDLFAFHHGKKISDPDLLKLLRIYLAAGTKDLSDDLVSENTIITSFNNGGLLRAIFPLVFDHMPGGTVHICQFFDTTVLDQPIGPDKGTGKLEDWVQSRVDPDPGEIDTSFTARVNIFKIFITNLFTGAAALAKQHQEIKYLNNEKKHYQKFYNEIPKGIILTTPVFSITDCNHYCLELLGYESHAEFTGLNLFNDLILATEHRLQIDSQLKKTGSVEKLTVELTCKNGHTILVSLSGKVQTDQALENPELCFVLDDIPSSGITPAKETELEATLDPSGSIDRDVTELIIGNASIFSSEEKNQQIEQDVLCLLESIANIITGKIDRCGFDKVCEYRNIVKYFPYVIFGYDNNRKIKIWNEAAEKKLGYSAGSIINKSLEILIPDFDKAVPHPVYHNEITPVLLLGDEIELKKSDNLPILFDIKKSKLHLDGSDLHLVVANDRSETKRLRKLIDYTASKLSSLQLVGEDVVLVTDIHGFISEVNSRAINLLGYLESELLGEHLVMFVSQADREKVELAMQMAIQSSDLRRIKTSMISADDKEIPVQLNMCSLRELSNAPIGIMVLIQDHSKVDSLQQRLSRMEEQLNLVAQLTDYGIFCYSISQKKVVEINQVGLKILGFSSLEELNRFPLEKLVVDHKKLAELKHLVQSRHEITEFKLMINRQNGEKIMVRLNLRPRVDTDHAAFYQGSFQEIRQAIEQDLRLPDLTQQFLLFLHTFQGGLAFLDPLTKIEPLNDQFYKIFNRTVEEFKRIKAERLVHKSDRLWVLQYWHRVLAGQESTSYQEFAGTRKGGKKVFLGCISAPVNYQGEVTGLHLIVYEIKEYSRKKAHSERLASISTLASGFVHDFNNLLTEISAQTYVLLVKNKLTPQQRDNVLRIQHLSNWAGKLTQQLLGIQKEIKPVCEPFQLNHLIQEVIFMLQYTFEPFIKIKEELGENLKIIKGDVTQLQQVLLNLCINSRDAMPGGGEIRFKTQNIVIDSDTAAVPPSINPGNYVLLQVSDTGIGMSSEVQKKIFEPFFTTKKMGTGLGLYQTLGIIKNHNGIINVVSKQNVGTTLSIYLPAYEGTITECHQSIEKIQGGNETIMLIDDEENILNLSARMLEKYGYSVITMTDGQEAIKIFENKNKRIDLVVLDIVMQGLNGHECALQLSKIDPDVTILFTSGFRADPIIREILIQIKGDFLQKPFTMQTFLSKVRNILDKRKKIC